MKINLMLAYNFCSLGLIFVLKKNNFFFHFNRTAEPDQSILIYDMRTRHISARNFYDLKNLYATSTKAYDERKTEDAKK